jgi:hypothetical protein
MSTPQSIEAVTPRIRIRPGRAVTALGFLIAIAVTIMFLTLTGTNHHTTAVIPAPTSQAGATATPPTHYLGPRQLRADGGATPTVGASNSAPRYTCLGGPQRCLR